jgi:hypothetical protein
MPLQPVATQAQSSNPIDVRSFVRSLAAAAAVAMLLPAPFAFNA